MQQVDFLVVGSGPAGQRAAIQAAKFGKKVVLVERRSLVGGVTVHTGTIPSKSLREAILYLTGWRQRGIYGHDNRAKDSVTVDDLVERLQPSIRHEIDIINDQLHRNGVTVITGEASFADAHVMNVLTRDGEITQFTSDRFFLATGTSPRRPDYIPFNNTNIIDSDGLLRLKSIPKSIVIYGAGAIGVEYASMLKALDIDVTLINEGDRMLPFIDHEVMDEFTYHLRESGVRLMLGEKLNDIHITDSGDVELSLQSGRSVISEVMLFTAGRTGCTDLLKLSNAGLRATDRNHILVNENFQTDVPHIYAAGDLIGFPSLASTSMEQGRVAACHAFGEPCNKTPEHFPYGIYSLPEISMIGRTEQSLIADGVAYEIGIAKLQDTARGQIMGLGEGLLKILVDVKDHRILGVHIVGEGATELIHIGQAVMTFEGKLEYFVENVFNYPTLAEAYKIAALDAWNRLR